MFRPRCRSTLVEGLPKHTSSRSRRRGLRLPQLAAHNLIPFMPPKRALGASPVQGVVLLPMIPASSPSAMRGGRPSGPLVKNIGCQARKGSRLAAANHVIELGEVRERGITGAKGSSVMIFICPLTSRMTVGSKPVPLIEAASTSRRRSGSLLPSFGHRATRADVLSRARASNIGPTWVSGLSPLPTLRLRVSSTARLGEIPWRSFSWDVKARWSDADLARCCGTCREQRP